MSRAILTGDAAEEKRAPRDSEPAFLWAALVGTGLSLSIIGWMDVALLWYPLNFGNMEWEFGTVGAHVMGMPLGTLGLVMLGVGATGKGWSFLARATSVASWIVVLSMIALAVLYALVLPIAWAGTPPEMRSIIVKAIAKTIMYLTVYLAFYSWFGVYVWRASATPQR